jgi:hypothetical protein
LLNMSALGGNNAAVQILYLTVVQSRKLYL